MNLRPMRAASIDTESLRRAAPADVFTACRGCDLRPYAVPFAFGRNEFTTGWIGAREAEARGIVNRVGRGVQAF
jgi:hypothetical protein